MKKGKVFGKGQLAIGIMVVALVAAIALLVLNWDTVSQKASSVWHNIQDCWGKAYSWFKTMVLI